MGSAAWLWVASALSLAMAAGHVTVAGAIVVRPLLESEALPTQVRWLAYFCWHVVTLLAVGMAVGFALVAAGLAPVALAAFLTALTLGCAALGGVIAVRARLSIRDLPPPVLFLLIGLLGAAGLLVHR